MTPWIGLAALFAIGVSVWLYDHGLANALEAVAIRLLRHARWLRERHARQERSQADQLMALVGAPTFEEMVERR